MGLGPGLWQRRRQKSEVSQLAVWSSVWELVKVGVIKPFPRASTFECALERPELTSTPSLMGLLFLGIKSTEESQVAEAKRGGRKPDWQNSTNKTQLPRSKLSFENRNNKFKSPAGKLTG